MFIKYRLSSGDKVTITFIGDKAHEITGTLLGYDEHHLGLNTGVEQYIPWTAVGSVTVVEKAVEEVESVDDSF